MPSKRTSIVLAAAMCVTAVASVAVRPSATASQKGESISLEAIVPKDFGGWRELEQPSAQVVNPQTRELLDKLYSQILTRTYVNNDGYRIMLSLAYGDDQRGGLQAHRPEVCYPAQGFQLRDTKEGTLPTPYGSIDVRRLSTRLGTRNEPVTYWLTVGDQAVSNNFEKRLAQIRLGLTGQIPDGLLFRVSSIDDDSSRAFEIQQRFAADLISAVPPLARKQLSGLGTPKSATATAS